MSFAEFIAAIEGWNRCHGPEQKPEGPSEEEFESWLDEIEERKKWLTPPPP